MRRLLIFALVLVFGVSGCGKVQLTQKDVSIIPKSVIFGNPQRDAPSISPDGTKLAWLAPSNGLLNLWVADVNQIENAKPVSNVKDRPIAFFRWDYTNNLIYHKDDGGNENYHIYRIDLATGIEKDLTPGKGFTCYAYGVNSRNPQNVVIMINDRKPEYFDLKKLNLVTGKTELIYTNDNGMSAIFDDDFKVRLGVKETPDGGKQFFKYEANKWILVENVPFEDMATFIYGFDRSGKYFYMQDSRNSDTSALMKVDAKTWDKTMVAQDPKSDMDDWIFEPATDEPIAVAFNYDRKHWTLLKQEYKKDLDYIAKIEDADFSVEGMSLDASKWVVTFTKDNGPVKCYLYDRNAQTATFLFPNRPDLDKFVLAKMKPQIVKTRDGLDLVCYISLPPWSDGDEDGIPDEPLPMVLNVHGGPTARDSWGYNSTHQFLANRGYAVMSVNYRGSYGFGKNFLNKGNGQWGGKMHDDLLDAVDWAIAQKIAIPEKVCIFGGSYGGYATLVGMTFTPDKFACGVDVVGISNLITFMKSVPPYWKSTFESWKRQVGGDPDTEDGKAYLKSKSPLTYADKIIRPLLIGHGFNDPRVKVAESEQIVKSMQDKKIPVTYCLYPDEGHGFAKPENKLSFFAMVESFLAKNLGGRAEVLTSDDFKGSSIQIKAGIETFEGLDKLLPKPAPPKVEK